MMDGSSRKQKRNLQIGNKILLNWKAKGENRIGYFSTELIKPISPFFFDDKERSICILAACSILKILLPERQINKKIYLSFENFLTRLFYDDWINLYIDWELSLVKELGYESENQNNLKNNIRESLMFNKKLLIENFILPNKLSMPVSRNILEHYFIDGKWSLYLSLVAIWSAKYVTIADAPALLKEIKLSIIASSLSIPLIIPFLIKLYSPETW